MLPDVLAKIEAKELLEPVSDSDRTFDHYLMAKPQVFNVKDQAWYDLTVSSEHEFVRWPKSMERAIEMAKGHAETYGVKTRVITFVPTITAEFQ